MKKLSICIPTFNRSIHLNNCLNSIKIAKQNSDMPLEVCISDNCSSEQIENIINNYKKELDIVYNRNNKNIGLGNNILKSVSIASGEFAWIIGNDDLILPDTLKRFSNLNKQLRDVDFYYANSFHIEYQFIKNFPHPIDINNLDLSKLKKFSGYNISRKLKFFELIDPKKSYEFLLSMYLCIFRKKYWDESIDVINKKLILDVELYSNFDNTAPHIKIWSKSFSNKMAYFISNPLTANVHGPRSRDWGNLYPFVEAVRIPQVLDCYRSNGLPFLKYIKCKNFALRRFIPSFYYMIKNPKSSGLKFVNIKQDMIRNLIYPSIYFSGLYYFLRRVIITIKKQFEFKF